MLTPARRQRLLAPYLPGDLEYVELGTLGSWVDFANIQLLH
jgi:hypothetical protein